MRRKMVAGIVSVGLTLIITGSCAADNIATRFATNGNGIRKLTRAQHKAKDVIYVSELDGAVACHTLDGQELWRRETDIPAVMFDLIAVDVNNDGRDDAVTASGDGSILCLDSSGKELWRFRPEHKVRFSEVAAVQTRKGPFIFAGGNNQVLYKLDRKGNVVATKDVDGAFRKIESGNFVEKDKPSLFVMTLKHDKSGFQYFGFLDPDTLDEQAAAGRSHKKQLRNILTGTDVSDLDGDGRDDLLLFYMGKDKTPEFYALNGELETVASFVPEGRKFIKTFSQRYAHAVGASLLPVRDEIFMQFGRCVFILDRQGKLLETMTDKMARFTLSDFDLDIANKRLYGAGEVSGGNDVYAFDLTQDQWWMQHTKWIGRMAAVTENLGTLYKQVLEFERPAYQKKPEKEWMMVSGTAPSDKVKALNGADMAFIEMEAWKEDYDRSHLVEAMGEKALTLDSRGNPNAYNKTRAELVNRARDFEKNDQPFIIWAGHGIDLFYMHIETMEEILQAAPNSCYGFLFAEMENHHDPRSHYFVNTFIPRLVKAMRKQGKAKLFFRYKQTFWAKDVYMEPWKTLFLSKKYADVLVPATEDTNSFSQELNLIGRVGMYLGGYANDFGIRLVDDNVTGWRPVAPAMQKSYSPWLRSAAIRAGYGARFSVLYPINAVEKPGVDLLYALMCSGVLPLVENSDQIESIGSWHLIDDVNPSIANAEKHGHDISVYEPDDTDFVISCAEPHWAGASVTDHDLSRFVGVNYRWLHFVPELPYGMIPIAPAEMADELKKNNIPFTVSDLKYGKVNGKDVKAADFGPTIKAAAEAGLGRLPVRVSGAAWSAVRLDENHIRVSLIDPHYLDARDCPAVVTFQGKQPQRVVDILGKQLLKAENKSLKLTVPAGSMRFIDLTY